MKLVPATSLIDDLLAEQQSLTAVERFSQFHSDATEPVQAKYYQDLIPLSRPGEGEQYAFEVDLDACSGCKACVTACHSLNGLDEGESWRDVGTLYTPEADTATQQTVTTACHHCSDPACANGCPTLAYDKDAETGIVRHLDDQCIGCQYCTLTCPYDVPKYNDRLGIVRKCDMCHGRLKEGEAPACVQACPNEAIKIRIVSVSAVSERSTPDTSLLPGTVPSSITRPTTTFLNLRQDADEEPAAADRADLTPAHRHTPLVFMLVMTQAAAGLLLFDWITRAFSFSSAPGTWHAVLGFIVCQVGLAGATFHLGRPLQGWRSFLGWRKSWLSREILVFGAWAGAFAAYLGTLWLELPQFIELAVGAGAVMAGLTGVFCSMMVYAFTKRPFWKLSHTATRFGLTTIAIGASFTFPVVAAAAIAAKLAFEYYLAAESCSPFPKSARLIKGPLGSVWLSRLGLGAIAFFCAIISIFLPILEPVTLLLMIASELFARALYFQAVVGGRPHHCRGAGVLMMAAGS